MFRVSDQITEDGIAFAEVHYKANEWAGRIYQTLSGEWLPNMELHVAVGGRSWGSYEAAKAALE